MEFSFNDTPAPAAAVVETPLTPEKPITSEDVERKITEAAEPKRRGRKPGTTNKPKDNGVSTEQIKLMFSPLVVAVHNGLLKLLKLSEMDSIQEKMVSESYAMLLYKRAPEFLEKHGDYIAALGATALIFGAKLTSESTIFKPKEIKKNEQGKTEQYNNDIGPEGKRENNLI